MTKDRKLARRRLDERLAALRAAGPAPPQGWIKAVRESIGMSATQLAERLGVRQPTIVDLERSEAAGRITLASLKRAAEALDCTLVYALVPKTSLEEMVAREARAAAKKELEATLHTMALEAQSPRPSDRKDMHDKLSREIAEAGGRRLWG